MQHIEWARKLQAIAQSGLAYSRNVHDIERYEQMRRLAAEMVTSSAEEALQIETLFAQEDGYATPKIDVRAALFREDKILMVREVADNGRWTLPGGWADVGDAPSTAVTKELAEESGFVATAVKLIALYDRTRHPHPPMFHHVYKLYFLCRFDGGRAQTSIETSEVAFFTRNNIPTDISLSRVTPQQIDRCFEHLYNPSLPTHFD